MERTDKWELIMKEAILDGVVSVLTQEGSEGLTMQRVAEEAGVAKGTLYSYFENKAALLKAVLRASIEPLSDQLDEILDGKASPADKIEQSIVRTLSYFDENRDMFRVLIHERHKVLGEKSPTKSSHYQELLDHLAPVISQGIREGQFRKNDPHKMATMLLGSTFFVVHHRLFTEDAGDVQEDCKMVYDIFLHGISL